ncbi:hypothetical protein LOK49_LG08G02238 [Camellia lanceoleosa]|uniref:Uncharacterized protein n=1 Tax=Camellia lanceoleosa TaxID=1840588 RepID=A0ACC0GMY0_9ERIC|nr:hypothetical protein LOK49_LG08G02238 [Camellia lanceoleosa]
MVMEDEEKGEEMRRNAKKWRDLAREAAKEGGSSNKNLMAFVEENITTRHFVTSLGSRNSAMPSTDFPARPWFSLVNMLSLQHEDVHCS